MFCFVFPLELRESAWAVGSCSISHSAGGIKQIVLFKTLQQSGPNALYKHFSGVTETTPSDEEEIGGQATAPSSKDSKDLSDVRKEALDKLKIVTAKYGKKLQNDDDFDFDINGDIENLDLSSSDEDE